jgi:RNA polymerase sigma-70 factor (family 1)
MSPAQLNNLVISISQDNDQEAFGVLFKRYFQPLISFGSSYIGNYQIVEEIVEDVFVKLWENRQMMPTIGNLSSYLYVATKYACINFLKSKKNQTFEELEEGSCFSECNAESTMVNRENIDVILSLINSLPPKCQLIFKLIKEEDMTYAEVAFLLDISVRTVNTQMTIAISKLTDGLKACLPELSSSYLRKSIS